MTNSLLTIENRTAELSPEQVYLLLADTDKGAEFRNFVAFTLGLPSDFDDDEEAPEQE